MQLSAYVDWAESEGVGIAVQIRPVLYQRSKFEPETHTGFMASDGFLYGEGDGLRGFYESYIPFLRETPGIQTVFLGVEQDYFIWGGGEKTRSFYEELLNSFRESAVSQNLSYASSAFYWDETYLLTDLLTPSVCGIPFGSMDYTGLTFYVPLADQDGASTADMLARAREYVQEYLAPLVEIYGNPLYIADFYCGTYDGCSIHPARSPGPGSPLDPEEARRWHTAWLRAFSEMNTAGEEDQIAGLTVGNYWLIPSRFIYNSDPHPYDALQGPNVNEHYRRDWYRNLIQAFLRDEPLDVSGT